MADQVPMTPEQLQAFITNAVNAAVANLNRAPNPGPSGTPPGSPSGGTSANRHDQERHDKGRWNAGDVGFFDPHYEGKTAETGSPIEHTGKETFFRDFHLFIERAKEVATIKGGEMVRNNLWSCLRGTALEWWTAEVSDAEKRLSKYGDANNLDEWSTLLAGRFKKPSHVAIDAVLRERYTMHDASIRREPREYAQKILRSAKDAGMTSIKNQLDIVFNGIDLELRRDIKPPEEGCAINPYLTAMDNCKHTWWAYASRHRNTATSHGSLRQQARPSYDSRPSNNFGQYNNPNRTGNQSNPFRPGYQTVPYNNRPTNPAYQPQQSRPFQANSQSRGQQQAQPQQRLQISAGPANVSGLPQQQRPPFQPIYNGQNPGRPNFQPQQGNQIRQPYQPYPSYPPSQRFQPNPSFQRFQPSQGNQATQSRYQPFPQQRAYQAYAEDAYDENGENVWDDYDYDYDKSYQYHGTEEDPSSPAEASQEEESRDGSNGSQEILDVNFAAVTNREHLCAKCQDSFPSRNKLFSHLRESCWRKPSAADSAPANSAVAAKAEGRKDPADVWSAMVTKQPSTIREPIKSTVSASTKPPGYAFRGWKYASFKLRLAKEVMQEGAVAARDSQESEACADTGCSVTLGDKKYVLRMVPGIEIRKMASPVPVKGLGNRIVMTDEYVVLTIFVDGLVDGVARTACFSTEVHLVEDLKANMLIGNDTLVPQGISIDYDSKLIKFARCENLVAPIDVVARSDPNAKRTIKAKNAIMIPPRMTMEVPVVNNGSIPNDRDFLFEPECQQDLGVNGGVFAHLVDSSFSFVQVYNATDLPIRLPRKSRLGSMVEYSQDGAYLASHEDTYLAVGNTKSWKKNLAKGITTLAVACAGMMANPVATPVQFAANPATPVAQSTSSMPLLPEPSSHLLDPALEHVMPSGLTIYGLPEAAEQIASVATEFPEIWTDRGTTVDIPEEEWMPIPLKEDAQPKPSRVYPVSQKDKEVINEAFDKLHQQGKMAWSNQPTPFSYPVFVVWRNMPDGSRKGRVVVDIRGLNKITESDSYPLPLQGDITSSVAGFPYISVVDAVGWFHQFNVRHRDRHKLTVVSHRGQEQSNVALMGYKGSPPYVQRQTDKLLRPYRSFAKAYVDDMIIFSKTLVEHLQHLRTIFQLFQDRRISLSPTKSFLGYPTVILLGQRVDSLGLTTSEEKLAAISALAFPRTLRDLEVFLGLTGWLRSSIPRYAQLAQPLQQRKTLLARDLKDSKGTARKRQSSSAFYEPTSSEIQSFQDLKQAFSRPSFLVHFDPDRQLLIDLDASKAWGFAAMVYHVKKDVAEGFARTDVQPILFLSKMLNQAELNYWPTELEVAGLVWVVKKVRHMVESTKRPTIIYTDHSAAVPISKQASLTTSSTDKLNLRLVRASQYLSSFDLVVKHKAGKSNVVPDALSRLKGTPTPDDATGVLDALHTSMATEAYAEEGFSRRRDKTCDVPVFHVTLVEMSDLFKQRLVKEYEKDDQWSKLLSMLQRLSKGESVEDEERKRGIRFKLREGLIYYTNFDDGRERLCVPNSMEAEIFQLAHDRQYHGGYHRSYERVAGSIYMRHMAKSLRTYVEHCPECQLNQTKRHAPYGSMVPIDRPAIPFYTVAMDFIVALPVSVEGYDSLLTMTCKFSKRVLLVPGMSTWDASLWADAALAAWISHGWGIPAATISDRDSKFMSEFWNRIFGLLGTEILASTAWHPQTDGQSERTNQTVEVAMRFYLTTRIDASDWPLMLPYLQGSLNNAKNQSTGVSPNEILYGFNVRDPLGVLTELPAEDFSRLRQLKRDEAEESLAFANAMAKERYDHSHKALDLPVGSQAFLRLHHGYELPGISNKKLHQQRAGPFKILEKVGSLAYRLELPPVMQIHPVISIAQLEPVPTATDPYSRPRNIMPPPITEGDPEDRPYEIEKLLDKRSTSRGIRYLVKWKDHGNEHNVWYDVKDLSDAQELVQEYEERQSMLPDRPRRQRHPRKPGSEQTIIQGTTSQEASATSVPIQEPTLPKASETQPSQDLQKATATREAPPQPTQDVPKRGRGRPRKELPTT